jgi:hypothetical protein
MRGKKEGIKPILIAYKITMNDASRVYVFEPALSGKDKNRRGLRGKMWRTRIWYKKY